MIYCMLSILAAAVCCVWGFSCFLKSYYNWKAYREIQEHPDNSNMTAGMVLNVKTGKLEGDSSPILPF